MDIPSTALPGAMLTGGEAPATLPDEWRLARAARLNVLLLGMPRVNPLLSDLQSVIENVIERILPDLQRPVASWCPGSRLVLPAPAQARTLILYEVGSLVSEDQKRLLEWLERAEARTQVASTCSTSLLPLVHTGVFNATLYYRLNTVCLDLSA
jgi:transcriptional regulator of aromatic amino acid metabolism